MEKRSVDDSKFIDRVPDSPACWAARTHRHRLLCSSPIGPTQLFDYLAIFATSDSVRWFAKPPQKFSGFLVRCVVARAIFLPLGWFDFTDAWIHGFAGFCGLYDSLIIGQKASNLTGANAGWRFPVPAFALTSPFGRWLGR